MFADLWCVSPRPPIRIAPGIARTPDTAGTSREFIFTVQFSYDLTHYDGGDQYDYMHLVYLGQYDNNGIWAGTPRDLEQRPPVPPR